MADSPPFRTASEAEDALKSMMSAPSIDTEALVEMTRGGLSPQVIEKLPEMKYQTLLEQIPAVTFMASFEGDTGETYVSPQIETLLGYTQKEWLANPTLWYDRLHPEDRDRWQEEFKMLLSAGEHFHSIYRFFSRDDRTVWILGDIRIVRDASGIPCFIQGVGFDVTELKRTQVALETAQQNLQEIVSTIRETFWVMSSELDHVLYASPAFETIWGLPAERLSDSPSSLVEVVHPADRERFSRALETMKSEETEIEHRLAGTGGRIRWVRSRTFPVRKEGAVSRVIAVSEDVTDRKELEVQVQQVQEREMARLRLAVRKESTPDQLLLGSSECMKRLRARIQKVASSNATVLVTGESGTGKELVATALHYGGRRAQGPFVEVNCAAIPETLLESELFGAEKGAATGVTERRIGKFEQAHGGTLFLDEIGDMPLAMQAKILKVLEDRTVQRLGGKEKINADVRVICATNRDLEEEVAKGTFRQDLYYRVNTIVLQASPLRERASDIPELVEHFLRRANREELRRVEVSDAAMQILKAFPWPGNVRELRHAIEQAVVFCESEVILPDDLPPAVTGRRPEAPAPEKKRKIVDAVQELERCLIVEALKDAQGVKTEAGRSLGIPERNLSYKMDKLRIVALREAPWAKVC